MKQLVNTSVGRLRLISYLEGLSLLILLFVAVPMKYIAGNASLSTVVGPVHGLLFLLFIFTTLSVGVEYRWQFRTTTWKVLLACIVPFGTFYIDRQILARIVPSDRPADRQ